MKKYAKILEKKEGDMAGKLGIMKKELTRQIKIISISSTVIINLLYISYLRFALRHSIGNRYVNFALTIATALFLVIYLILRLFGENKRSVKKTKRVYKRFKLLTKIFTVGMAIYALATAVGTVSPMATLFATVNAVLLGIRLIIELIASLIGRGVSKAKNAAVERRLNKKREVNTYETDFTEAEVEDVKIELNDL
jgi:divalent metal cation (Fe/Co/Zn/Cd) transporter